MPKMFGLGLLPVIIASVVFFFIGYLWYGVVFSDAWMAAHGVTVEAASGESPLWMIGGFVITVMQVIGLGLVMKWKNALALTAAVLVAAALWICFALPFTLYDYFYLAHDAKLLAIDAGHMLVGWLASAAVLSLMKV